MNKKLQYLLTWLFVMAISYLIGSFVELELNLLLWDETTRFMVALPGSLIAIYITDQVNKDEEYEEDEII